jgi:hypothetical protein
MDRIVGEIVGELMKEESRDPAAPTASVGQANRACIPSRWNEPYTALSKLDFRSCNPYRSGQHDEVSGDTTAINDVAVQKLGQMKEPTCEERGSALGVVIEFMAVV